MANTTNLNLVKPAGTDYALVSVINGNMDIIDSKVGAIPANESAQSQITALNNQITKKNTLIKNANISNTDDITGIDCSNFRYVLVSFSGNLYNHREFLFPVNSYEVSQEVKIDASASIYIHLIFRLNFTDKKMYINSYESGTWGSCAMNIYGVE